MNTEATPGALGSNDGLGRWWKSGKEDADTQKLRAVPQRLHRAASKSGENALL